MDKTEREVLTTVLEMNRCWTCGQERELEKLGDYFHHEMVAITPMDRLRIEGREACVAGWSKFARAVRIQSWKEKEIRVQIYGDAAVVTYYYDMVYERDGNKVSLGGRDMLTLIKEEGKWLLAANQFSPFPQQ